MAECGTEEGFDCSLALAEIATNKTAEAQPTSEFFRMASSK
jgi:hypothetical protein